MRWARQLALAGALVTGATGVASQPVADPGWAAALKAQRFTEVQSTAAARIAARPDDLDAFAALINATLATNDAVQRRAALAHLESCVQRLPQAAVCHYGVGAVLGVQAVNDGMVKAALSAGRIRDAFIKAVSLDSSLYVAHSGLVQFYLLAPGMIGGSVAKAGDAARAAAAKLPEHAKLLQALVAIERKELAEAERLLAAVAMVAGDDDLANDVASGCAAVGIAHMSAQQPTRARPVFERLVRERPQQAIGHYGLARVHSDAGAWDLAVALLERSARLEGADGLPVDYRLGIAWQAKGERDKARGAFTRFVTAGKGSPRSLDDAKKRLTEL